MKQTKTTSWMLFVSLFVSGQARVYETFDSVVIEGKCLSGPLSTIPCLVLVTREPRSRSSLSVSVVMAFTGNTSRPRSRQRIIQLKMKPVGDSSNIRILYSYLVFYLSFFSLPITSPLPLTFTPSTLLFIVSKFSLISASNQVSA